MSLHSTSDAQTSIPRILCLHGGGSSAEIFKTQCRVLIHHLAPLFRLVFVDAPLLSGPGPDVVPTYEDMGPFRSWLLPSGELHSVEDVQRQLNRAIEVDNRAGWTGDWIGFLGFSQGGKMTASLLLEVQHRRGSPSLAQSRYAALSSDLIWQQSWRFAIILAGRAPMVSFNRVRDEVRTSATAILSLPTLHVHGLADPGLPLHRELYELHCQPGMRRLMEWEGGHRVPIKSREVGRLVEEIKTLASFAGTTS